MADLEHDKCDTPDCCGECKDDHPIYKCQFYIWEEKRLTNYTEWINYYRKQEEEERLEGKHYTSIEELTRGIC